MLNSGGRHRKSSNRSWWAPHPSPEMAGKCRPRPLPCERACIAGRTVSRAMMSNERGPATVSKSRRIVYLATAERDVHHPIRPRDLSSPSLTRLRWQAWRMMCNNKAPESRHLFDNQPNIYLLMPSAMLQASRRQDRAVRQRLALSLLSATSEAHRHLGKPRRPRADPLMFRAPTHGQVSKQRANSLYHHDRPQRQTPTQTRRSSIGGARCRHLMHVSGEG